MSATIAFGLLSGTLYFLVDLYFVAHLSAAAVAGVSSAGAAMFIVFACSQVLGVGTVSSISHAVGEKNQPEANRILNDALVLSALFGIATLVLGYPFASLYMRLMGADAPSAQAGVTFLHWTLAGLALQFPLVVMGSALRGAGVVRPAVIAQSVSVGLNILLAPVLIAGWGTHYPMGVAGAGLASAIAMAVAVLILLGYFLFREKYLLLGHLPWLPRLPTWRRILAVGLPAGGEFVISFLLIGITYYSVGRFGAAAQAGTGIGGRIAQALLMPAMAIAFAAGPIAGQNFGAGQAQRVRETFRVAATLGTIATVGLIPLLLWVPNLLVDPFTTDPAVRAISIVFLQITSWGLIAQALIYTCSSLFQGIGHTTPALMAAATRILTFAVPAIWLSTLSNFRIEDLWYVQLGSTALEAIMSAILLNAAFKRRLSAGPVITTTVA